MSSLKIITNIYEPNTKLNKKQLSDLDEELDNADNNRDVILKIALILRKHTLSPLTEQELDRMIYALQNNKGKLREIQSIISRIIMISVPSTTGGRIVKRKTRKIRKNKKTIRKN